MYVKVSNDSFLKKTTLLIIKIVNKSEVLKFLYRLDDKMLIIKIIMNKSRIKV